MCVRESEIERLRERRQTQRDQADRERVTHSHLYSRHSTHNHPAAALHQDKKPAGAGTRCITDCSIESSCPYSAVRIYRDRVASGATGWPCSVLVDARTYNRASSYPTCTCACLTHSRHCYVLHLTTEPTVANIEEAIRTGPYGRCVWESDNDVLDNQVQGCAFFLSPGRPVQLHPNTQPAGPAACTSDGEHSVCQWHHKQPDDSGIHQGERLRKHLAAITAISHGVLLNTGCVPTTHACVWLLG